MPTSTDGIQAARLLPSVSEVVSALERGREGEIGALHKAARQVCAEELLRVKQGHVTAPVDILVARARDLLATPGTPAPRTPPVVPDVRPPASPAVERRPPLGHPLEDELPFRGLFADDRRSALPFAAALWALLAVSLTVYHLQGAAKPHPAGNPTSAGQASRR
jgi:hypothetical protein